MAKQAQKQNVTIESFNLNVDTEEREVKKPAEVTVQPQVKGEKLVKVKPKTSFRIYIGDRYYNFTKGEIALVSENVKDILMRQGALDAI